LRGRAARGPGVRSQRSVAPSERHKDPQTIDRHVGAFVDEVQRLDVAARGYTSAPERRQMANLRSTLFALRELEATQHRLLAPEQELAQALPDSAARLLRQAAAVLDDNRATAGRLYALLGDLLAEQSSVVFERLTLVSTIFLPLTLATGFFGMNFDWMTNCVGTLGAFVTLGIVVPVLLATVTFVLIRRLSTPT
jgi:Mg2+ and Co2+ transporter CorA